MRRETVYFVLFLTALFGAGLLLGRAVASHPKLETFKLLNIVGVTYDLLGLLVLSEIVSSSERWKSLVVHWLAGLLLWAQSVMPLGAALGAWVSGEAPSSTKAATFFGSLWVYSLLPLAVLDATVFYPRMNAAPSRHDAAHPSLRSDVVGQRGHCSTASGLSGLLCIK